MKRIGVLYILLSILFTKSFGQQASIAVTDSLPYEINGLKIGYKILSAAEKEVGSKGNFSRYSIQFFVTNTSTEAKIILYKQQGFFGMHDQSEVVQFKCNNATGARLTTKESILQAKPCNLLADVEDKDAGNKTIINRRNVQIGYWIKAGETISNKGIVIVPLNQKPEMNITLLYNPSVFGSAAVDPFYNNQQNNSLHYYKIKSSWSNTYLNNQSGALTSSLIQDDWYSAQWQLQLVPGTNYYSIKNRWRENFLSAELPGNMLSANSQPLAAMWILEPASEANTYRIKNAANGTYLSIYSGSVQSVSSFSDSPTSHWMLEQL